MLNIKNNYPETLTKKDIYRLTRGESTMAKNIDTRQELTPTAWAVYEEGKPNPKTGEVEYQEILAIQTEEMGVISTVSETFKRDFFELWEMMDGETFTFHTVKGQSKAGREFVTCTLLN